MSWRRTRWYSWTVCGYWLHVWTIHGRWRIGIESDKSGRTYPEWDEWGTR